MHWQFSQRRDGPKAAPQSTLNARTTADDATRAPRNAATTKGTNGRQTERTRPAEPQARKPQAEQDATKRATSQQEGATAAATDQATTNDEQHEAATRSEQQRNETQTETKRNGPKTAPKRQQTTQRTPPNENTTNTSPQRGTRYTPRVAQAHTGRRRPRSAFLSGCGDVPALPPLAVARSCRAPRYNGKPRACVTETPHSPNFWRGGLSFSPAAPVACSVRTNCPSCAQPPQHKLRRAPC